VASADMMPAFDSADRQMLDQPLCPRELLERSYADPPDFSRSLTALNVFPARSAP
jgi:hypothetical protein